jgi:hypothetical protein
VAHAYPSDLLIGVFKGASDDILKFDLSFLNLRIQNVSTKKFESLLTSVVSRKYLETFHSEHLRIYKRVQLKPGQGKTFALIPIDFKQKVPEITFRRLQDYFTLVSPSQFKMEELVHYSNADEPNKYDLFISTIWGNDNYENPIFTLEGINRKRANDFLKLCFLKIPENKLFNIGILNYASAFTQATNEMSFLNYCTALEAFSQSSAEITHRICRMVAVLNSDSKEEGDIIYFNMTQFYSLRSLIIHGSAYENSALEEYFYPLQHLVRDTIVQILYLKIQDGAVLNKLINQSGYGDRKKFEYESKGSRFNSKSRSYLAKVKRIKK